MSRTTKLVIAAIAVVSVAAAIGAVMAVRHGVSARVKPFAIETFVARRLRRLAIPADARATANPVAVSAQAIAEGRAHFADHCALCHANDGSGDTEIGRGLYPPAPDMRKPESQSLGDGEIFWIIRNGVRFTGMPAWGEGPPQEDLASWKLVHFIRHLPDLSAEELQEMRQLNPKSPQERGDEAEAERFLEGADDPAAAPSAHRHHHH